MVSENVDIQKCKIHNIPMSAIYGEFEEGKETPDVEGWYCEQCTFEEEMRTEYYDRQEGPDAAKFVSEKVKEIKNKKPFKPLGGINLIRDLERYLQLSDAPPSAIHAMATHIISSSLYNAKSGNSKGQILANLGFVFIGGSGSNKTPLIDMGIDRLQKTSFSDYKHYSSLTGKGIRRDIAKLPKEKKHNIMITWDEAQEMTQNVKSAAMKDTYSVLSQILDNKIRPYVSVAGGQETYPPLYGTIWITGVPEFLKDADKNFWFQGFGLRCLYPKYEISSIKDLREEEVPDDYYLELDKSLLLLRNIEYVDKTTEFFDEYNKYRREILEEINKIQADLSETQNPENFPVLSRVKYPVLVWKLSMINAASRGNFDDKLLLLELEDLEWAKNELEEYNKNMLEIFDVWMQMQEKDMEIKTTRTIEHRMKKFITNQLSRGNRWTIKSVDTGNGIKLFAEKSENGSWTPREAVLKPSHMTSVDFDIQLQTLIETMQVFKREAIYEKNGVEHAITLLSIDGNIEH